MNRDFSIAAHKDASDIAALVNRAYRPVAGTGGWTHETEWVRGSRTSEHQVIASMNSGSVMLIRRKADSIIACVQVSFVGSVACIGMLATDPGLQALGHGKRMLEDAEWYAKQSGTPTTLQLSVIECRTELVAFYERRGYRRTGIASAYPLTGEFGVPVINEVKVLEMTKATGIRLHPS